MAFRMADSNAGVALGGGEMSEIRSGTVMSLRPTKKGLSYLGKKVQSRPVDWLLFQENR